MLALVRSQIDVGDRPLEERQHGTLDPGRVACEREDRPVVRLIGRVIEEADAWRRADRFCHRRDRVGASAFADVRNALDQGHRNC